MSSFPLWWVPPMALAAGVFCAALGHAYADRIAAGAVLRVGTFAGALADVVGRSRRPFPPRGLSALCALTLLAVWAALSMQPWPAMVLAARGLACACLLVLAIVDARTGYLPDALTLPLLAGGLVLAATGRGVPFDTAVIAAASGYLSLFLFNAVYRCLRRQQGMGGGDMKLYAALGAWLGWTPLPGVLLLACISGLVFAVLRPGRERWSRPLAFGPFLAGAGVLGMVGCPVVQFHF